MSIIPRFPPFFINTDYILALPRLSNGRISTNSPAAMNNAPLTYTGALVSRFANMATIGAIMPNTRFADAVMALPVPRSFVGKISGVYAYLDKQSYQFCIEFSKDNSSKLHTSQTNGSR